MSVPARTRQSPAAAAGQARRHRRASPTSTAYLKTILDERRRRPRRRSRRSTSASTSCRRCCPSKVDATLGAFWNFEGVQLQRARSAPARSSASTRPGVPTYDELVLVARAQDAARPTARCCGASCRRSRAATQALRRPTRRPASTRCSRPTPDLDRGLQLAQRQGDAAGVLPRDRQAASAGRTRRSGSAYGDWMLDNDLLSGRRPPARR